MIYSSNSNLESMIMEGKRIRRSNMWMCTATDPDAALKDRIDSAQNALSQWPVDSFQQKNLLLQIPFLVQFLKETA